MKKELIKAPKPSPLLDAKTKKFLQGVHPLLAACFVLAVSTSPTKVAITSGLRTYDEQLALFKAKKTPTMNSAHLLGLAIDVAIYSTQDGKTRLTWDLPWYEDFAKRMKWASDMMGISITSGCDWKSRDCVHFQLVAQF